MFRPTHQPVAYFGLWAEENAPSHAATTALEILHSAVMRCLDVDMRTEEVWGALDYLARAALRPALFDRFRTALDIADPQQRFVAVRGAYYGIAKALGAVER